MSDLMSAVLAAFVLFLAPRPTNALLAAFGAYYLKVKVDLSPASFA